MGKGVGRFRYLLFFEGGQRAYYILYSKCKLISFHRVNWPSFQIVLNSIDAIEARRAN